MIKTEFFFPKISIMGENPVISIKAFPEKYTDLVIKPLPNPAECKKLKRLRTEPINPVTKKKWSLMTDEEKDFYGVLVSNLKKSLENIKDDGLITIGMYNGLTFGINYWITSFMYSKLHPRDDSTKMTFEQVQEELINWVSWQCGVSPAKISIPKRFVL